MTNKKLEEILNKDKKFLLVMIPVILVLSLFLAYAFIPSFNETNIEDKIISLIEQSTNDTLSLLVQEDSTNDSEDDIESDVVSSQNVTNYQSNSVSGATPSDTGTTSTDTGTTETSDQGNVNNPETSASTDDSSYTDQGNNEPAAPSEPGTSVEPVVE